MTCSNHYCCLYEYFGSRTTRLTQVERHLEQEQEAEAINSSEALQETDEADDQGQPAEQMYVVLQSSSRPTQANMSAYNCGQCDIQSVCKVQ